jgi:hypothetical protein
LHNNSAAKLEGLDTPAANTFTVFLPCKFPLRYGPKTLPLIFAPEPPPPKTNTACARSAPDPLTVVLTNEELVEICAAQRTFEGAYIRTLLPQFSFTLVVLQIFTSEFYNIGAPFAVYGSGVLVASAYRRHSRGITKRPPHVEG